MNKEPRRVRIIAGKEPFKAQVIDVKTGEDLAGVITEITIRIQAKNGFMPVAEVTFLDPEIDVDATVVETTTVAYKHLEKGF